jgi:hypothetical protein
LFPQQVKVHPLRPESGSSPLVAARGPAKEVRLKKTGHLATPWEAYCKHGKAIDGPDSAAEFHLAQILQPVLFEGIPGQIRSGAIDVKPLDVTRPCAAVHGHHEISKGKV